MPLDSDQQNALDALISGESMFLTGGPGSGKSTVIQAFKDTLDEKHTIAHLGMTGDSAARVDGGLMYSFFGVGGRIHEPHDLSMSDDTYRRVRKTKTIIVEMASMARVDQMQVMRDRCFGAARGFGDFADHQLVLVGDLASIGPVANDVEKRFIAHYYGADCSICGFESRYWPDYARQELRGSYRASHDDALSSVLKAMRQGLDVDLSALNGQVAPLEGHAPQVVGSARKAAEICAAEMAKLDGGVFKIKGEGHNACRAPFFKLPDTLVFKRKARVIFSANDAENGVQAGSLGTLETCQRDPQGRPQAIVTLDDGREVIVSQHIWTPAGSGVECAQLPLAPGWAVDVHKAQGMTLEKAHVDPANLGDAGLLYAALGRLTSMSGLSLERAITADNVTYDARQTEYFRLIREDPQPEPEMV